MQNKCPFFPMNPFQLVEDSFYQPSECSLDSVFLVSVIPCMTALKNLLFQVAIFFSKLFKPGVQRGHPLLHLNDLSCAEGRTLPFFILDSVPLLMHLEMETTWYRF